MTGVNVRIFGTKQVQDAFKALPAKIQRQLMRKGLRDGGRIVRARARELVPVDQGDLKKSIKVRGSKAGKQAAFLNKKLGGNRNIQVGVQVVAEAPHAHLVEKGTKRMAAQPFLKPALDEKQEAIFDAVAASVQTAIKGS